MKTINLAKVLVLLMEFLLEQLQTTGSSESHEILHPVAIQVMCLPFFLVISP